MAGGTSLTGKIKIVSEWLFKNKVNTLAKQPPQEQGAKEYSTDFAYGTGENQVNQHWLDSRIVTTSSLTDDLDFNGSLTNIFGESILLTTIREIVIKNKSTVAGDDLLIGGAVANAFTVIAGASPSASLLLRASGIFVLSAPLDGYDVSAGAEDTLRIEHAGTSEAINYDIILKGTE